MLHRNASSNVLIPAFEFNPSIIGETIIIRRTNPLTGMETIRTVTVGSYASRMKEGIQYYVLNDSLIMLDVQTDFFALLDTGASLGIFDEPGFDPQYRTETLKLADAGVDILGNRITFHLDGYDRTLMVSDFNISGSWYDIVRPGSYERIIKVSDETLITV